jgi:hypothetical protein
MSKQYGVILKLGRIKQNNNTAIQGSIAGPTLNLVSYQGLLYSNSNSISDSQLFPLCGLVPVAMVTAIRHGRMIYRQIFKELTLTPQPCSLRTKFHGLLAAQNSLQLDRNCYFFKLPYYFPFTYNVDGDSSIFDM